MNRKLLPALFRQHKSSLVQTSTVVLVFFANNQWYVDLIFNSVSLQSDGSYYVKEITEQYKKQKPEIIIRTDRI